MGFKEKLDSLFHTADGEIQRAYNAYDKLVGLLDARDREADKFSRKQELDDQLKETELLTTQLLKDYEGVKSWQGIFREMHMNLARMFMRTERYDEATKECDKVAGYDPLDADELKNALQEIMDGKKLESAQLDEVGI